MMDWPSKITLRFLKHGNAIHRLLVFLLVKSRFRNDFPMGFFLTDVDGAIFLSREEIVSKINRSKKDSPMDYDGDLDDCNGLEIVIESAETLNARTENLKRFYPVNADEIQKAAYQSCNREFHDLKLIEQTPIKEEITVELAD